MPLFSSQHSLSSTSHSCVLLQSGSRPPPEVEAWVGKASGSQDVELQQRAYELQALLTAPPQVNGVMGLSSEGASH